MHHLTSPQARLTPALLIPALLCIHCTGDLSNASSPDAGGAIGEVDMPQEMGGSTTSPDDGTPDASHDLGTEDQTPSVSRSLRVEEDTRTFMAGESLDLGTFEVGQARDLCRTLTLTNDGEVPLMLTIELESTIITLKDLPEATLEPLESSTVEVCVDASQSGLEEATLTLTDDFSLTLTARIEVATPLLATGTRTLQISEDRGKTWQALEIPEGLTTIRGAIWARERFWLFGEGSSPLWQSTNGRTWSQVADLSPDITGITALAEDGQGNFMGVHEQAIIHAQDGTNWTRVAETVSEEETFLDITFFKGTFVAVGDSITAISEDGQSWKERRGWETSTNLRVIASGDHVLRVQGTNIQISEDAKTWKSDYTFCRDAMAPPSPPVISKDGAILSRCNGILKATSNKWDWRAVGKRGEMPTPLTFALDTFYGIDDAGKLVWSPNGLDWTTAESQNTEGVERIIAGNPPIVAGPTPSPADCTDGALACIDFEQELPGLPPIFQYGLRAGGENVVAIDDTFAFSGKHAMRVDVFAEKSGQGGMIAFEKEDFPEALHDKIHGRMMFYTASYPVRNWHMSESGGPLSVENTTNIQYNAGGDHARAFHNYYGNGADCWNRSDYTYPENQWFCWQVEYDRVNNTMVISVDGEEVHRMDGMGDGCLGGQGAQTIWQAPMTFEQFKIGYRPFKTQEQDLTTWIDDVAISDAPLPCPNMTP